MKRLNEMVDNYFKDSFGSAELLNLIEGVLGERETHADPPLDIKGVEEVKFVPPTFKISELNWGKPGTADRQIIQDFTSNIKGDTLKEKLININAVLSSEDTGVAGVNKLLSTMMVCEILSTILEEFTESAGGFIFEGFLTGLFGGESVQVTSPKDIKGMEDQAGKPITDIYIIGNKHYSLKLLGQETAVKGSFRNMVEHFESFDHVYYLDARRLTGKTPAGKKLLNQGLEFSEFKITLENFVDVFVTPFLKEVWKKDAEAPVKEAAQFKAVLQDLIADHMGIKTIKFGAQGIMPSKPKEKIFKFSPTVGGSWEDQEETGKLTGELNEEVKFTGKALNKFVQYIINMPDERLQEFAPFTIHYAERRFEGTKAEHLFGSYGLVIELQEAIKNGDRGAMLAALKKTPGYGFDIKTGRDKGSGVQFEFTPTQTTKIRGEGGHEVVGTLMLGESHMQQVWQRHADTLQNILNPIYSNLQKFTNNINGYLLGKDNRKRMGQAAIGDAGELHDSTKRVVSIVTPD